MGMITDENHRSLSVSCTYEVAELTGMDMQKFSELLSSQIMDKKVPVQKIVDITGLSKSYINKPLCVRIDVSEAQKFLW